MLKFILSADRTACTKRILEELSRESRPGGSILLVPEQFSHEAERALCRAGGSGISRYAEVLSFSRLASRVFSLYGGVCREYLDAGGRILSLYLAAEQVRPQIRHYAAVLGKPEFLEQLGTVIEEFTSWCVEPEQLRKAASHFEGSFAQKLTELALLYESYLSVCKTGREDPASRLVHLAEVLEERDFAAGKHIYVDGFSDFTGVQLRILSALLAGGCEMTVALAADGRGKSIFETAENTKRLLRRMAAGLQIPVQEQTLPGFEGRTPQVRFWLSHLFENGAAAADAESEGFTLLRAGSVQEECEFAARTVRRLTLQGYRARDISVALSDAGTYSSVLTPMLKRAGVPVYDAGSRDILRLPLTAWLLNVLQACERMEPECVVSYLKSPFSPLTQEAADTLERYAHFWDLRGSQWEKPFTMHPGGFGESWDDPSRQLLEQLNLWREAAVTPLAELRKKLKTAANAMEMLQALAGFLETLGVQETLQQRAETLNRQADPQGASEVQQLYEIVISAMEQAAQVLGALPMQPETFSGLMRLLLSQYTVGTIPQRADEVQLGPVQNFRQKQTRVLLVLGAEEGKLPSFAASAGLLTEQERQKLLGCGMALAPCRENQLQRELGWLYAALCAAQEQVILTCSGEQPSFLYEKTRTLLGLSETAPDGFRFCAGPEEAAASLRQTQGASAYPPELAQILQDLEEKGNYTFTPLKADTVHGLYGQTVHLSASKLDKFAACRYGFFLQYGLKARPWKEARMDAPIFGTFVHDVLENTVKEVRGLGGFRAVPEEQLREIALRHIAAYQAQKLPDLPQRGERFAYLFERSLQEVLAVVEDVGRELRGSMFTPQYEELGFGKEETLPPIRIETASGRAELEGFVDRVDLFEKDGKQYYRIVDYKTGHKDFDYADILCGEGLQMLIYLFALRRCGGQLTGRPMEPAGVLYVPARQDMERLEPGEGTEKLEKVRRDHLRRKGLVLDDPQILAAMEQNEYPEYLPCQRKKDVLTGGLASAQQLRELETCLQRTLQELTQGILSGTVMPNPIERGRNQSSCRYCDFKEACHRDAMGFRPRRIAAVKADEFWQEVERRNRNG